jgi:hypothetical protein
MRRRMEKHSEIEQGMGTGEAIAGFRPARLNN